MLPDRCRVCCLYHAPAQQISSVFCLNRLSKIWPMGSIWTLAFNAAKIKCRPESQNPVFCFKQWLSHSESLVTRCQGMPWICLANIRMTSSIEIFFQKHIPSFFYLRNTSISAMTLGDHSYNLFLFHFPTIQGNMFTFQGWMYLGKRFSISLPYSAPLRRYDKKRILPSLLFLAGNKIWKKKIWAHPLLLG